MSRQQQVSLFPLDDLLDEASRGIELHGAYNSAHEAYAIILEELEELWEEVMKKSSKRSKIKLYSEAIQVASTAYRYSQQLAAEIHKENENKPL